MQVEPVADEGEAEGVREYALVPHLFKVTWVHKEGEEEPQEKSSVSVFVAASFRPSADCQYMLAPLPSYNFDDVLRLDVGGGPGQVHLHVPWSFEPMCPCVRSLQLVLGQ